MAFLLEDRTIYLDRYAVSGEWTLNIADYVLSEEARTDYAYSAPTVSAGNNAAHFTVTSGVLGISSVGDAANLSAGTYTFTVSVNFPSLISPYNNDTCTLKIVCPAASIYVDPATGSPSNTGTKASPFSRSPDDPLASGNELSWTPTGPTLVVHKDGSLIRSRLVLKNVNTINAGNVGWGDGSPVTYCGADQVAAVAATTGDVFDNTNVANIKTQTAPFTVHISQYLVDRTNDSLMQWAQWPEVVGDPFLESHDPSRHLLGGMFRLPASHFATHTVEGVDSAGNPTLTNNVLDGVMTLPAAAIAEFGTKSLVGTYLGIWSGAAFVNWFRVTHHDVSTNIVTFVTNGKSVLQTVMVQGVATTAFQIVGHPFSIKAPNQFAWNFNHTKFHSWSVSGNAPEIPTRVSAFYAGPTITSGTIYGLSAEAYYGPADGEGTGWQKYSNGPDYTYNVLSCTFRWLTNRVGNGGGMRANGEGVAQNLLFEGNYVYDCIGAAGMRITTKWGSADCLIQSNRFKRINVTCVYFPSSKRLVYQRNHMEDVVGPHANGFTIYASAEVPFPPDNIIRHNTFKRVCRAMTLSACPGLRIYRNFFEIDEVLKDAIRFYVVDPDTHVYQNIFCQPAGVAPTGEDALAAGGTSAGLWENNVIAGLTGGAGGTGSSASWINNLLSYHPSNGTNISTNSPPAGNTGTWSGNVLEPATYDGVILPRWKQVVTTGVIGRSMMVSGIAVISFSNLIGQEVNAPVESIWRPLDSDGPRPISITNGEYNIADDVNGTGAIGWSSSPSTVADGKFIKLRTTTPTGYETNKSVTLDLGDGNVYTWSVLTKQASGYPLIAVDSVNDWWRFGVASKSGTLNSKFMTFAFFGRFDGSVNNAGILLGHYAGGASTRLMFETINSPSNRLRITGRPAASPDVSFSFITGAVPTDTNVMLIITVDTTKATGAEGIRIYMNGVVSQPASVAQWFPDYLIDYEFSTTLFKVGPSFNGLIGMMFLDNRLVDITDPNVRDKFNAHRIGLNGENIFGTPPGLFLTGTKAEWEAGGGLNRGTLSGKMLKQGSTDVSLDSGGASAWPSYTFASALTNLTGPSGTIYADKIETYTVTANGALANPLSVTLTDGGAGGTFNPTSLTFPPSTGSQTLSFDYIAAEGGSITIQASASGVTSATKVLDFETSAATSYTFASTSATGVRTEPTDFVIELNGSNPSGFTFDFEIANGSGVFSSNPAIMEVNTTQLTVPFTPSTAGTLEITVSNGENLTNPPPVPILIEHKWKYIEPGETVVINKEQAESLEIVTSDETPATDLTFVELRWNRDTGNTGPINGVDVVGDILDAVAPVITSNANISILEGDPLSHALTANQTVTWAIVGGPDQSKFEISGTTLRFTANGTKDFNAPDDVGANNSYIVQVRATAIATGFVNTQTITVLVGEVDIVVLELDATGTQNLTVTQFDEVPDGNTVTITIDPDAPGTIEYLE